MAYEFKFPDVGEGITEGELIKWRIKVGDTVKEDEILADVETDKAVVEIPSPRKGTILELRGNPGEMLKVGEVIAVIGDTGEKAPVKEEKKEEKLEEKIEAAPKEKGGSTSVIGTLEDADNIPENPVKEARKEIKAVPKSLPPKDAVGVADKTVQDILALPKVRQLAKELGVDLQNIKGTGPGGRILEQDIRASQGVGSSAVEKKISVTRKYDMYGYADRVPLKGVRKAIAKNMSNSAFTIPHVTSMDKADVTLLTQLREKEKKVAEKKGVKLTYMAYIYKALVEALKQHPSLNASLDEATSDIVLKKYYNVGFAIDTEAGLMVPVIKGADKKSILNIAGEITSLASKAHDRTISIADMQGGTFTITNYGSIGGLYGTPIINHPESAILGIGKIQEEPVIIKGKVVPRKMLYLSLSFDHRILDGAEAARFLNTLKMYLEDPDALMLAL